MKKEVNSVMLIDDNKIDNFFHERILKKCIDVNEVIVNENGSKALEYILQGARPDIIFLDINMPVMGGREFLEEFVKLKKEYPTTYHCLIIVMAHEIAVPCMMDANTKLYFAAKPLKETVILTALQGSYLGL
jgi:CheY-like chemotaxis protein